MSKIAIFIPSLNRPNKLEALVNNIRENTSLPYKAYFMVSDNESVKILDRLGQSFYKDCDDTRYVTRMNFLYKNTTEPYMFMGSDDICFHKNWDIEAMKVAKDYPFVVGEDMFNQHGTMAFISRKYIKKHSGCIDVPDVLFYPGYQHNYADTEQFGTAQFRGVFARCLDSVVEHQHYGSGKSSFDPTYAKSNNSSGIDKLLFESRKHLWGQ